MSKAKAPRVFVPLTKVDEEQRLVYGRITAEEVDQSNEVMDYATSKPNFEKWSAQIEEASGGLSKGNLRVMHGLSVAGKLTDIAFDDDAQSIEVCAKVVDDTEWDKVLEGCYTGFSVGGRYGKKWKETVNGEQIQKFTAVPNEVSLVDNPCVKSATFTCVKADGAEELVKFLNPGDLVKAEEAPADEPAVAVAVEPSNDEVVAKAEQMAKDAADGTTWMQHVETARNELVKAMAEKGKEGDDNGKDAKKPSKKEEGSDDEDEEAEEGDADNAEEEAAEKAVKVTPPGIRQVWTASDGSTFEKKSDAESHEATLSKAAVEPTEADLLRERLAKATEPKPETGEASIFSVDRLDDLHKAVLELEQPREEDGSPKLEKGMYTVSRFANMIGDVAGLARTIKAEGTLEGDSEDQAVWKTLQGQLSAFGDSFMDYAKNQVAELVAGLDTDLSPRCAYDYYYRSASEGNDLAKHVVEMIEEVEPLVEEAVEGIEKLAKSVGFSASVEVSDELSPPMQKRFDALEAENADLKKIAGEAVEKVEELAKRIQTIEDTPLPRAPQNIAFREGDVQFMGKRFQNEEELRAELHNLIKTQGPDALAVEMIKAAQSRGTPLALNR